jgi:hypothetical protein
MKLVSILVLLFSLQQGILKFRIILKRFGTSGILVNVLGVENILCGLRTG